MKKYNSLLAASVLSMLFLYSCAEDSSFLFGDTLEDTPINIGGIETENMKVLTRAAGVDAETISWLVQPLKNGLDITYGLYGATDTKEDVAILKLTDETTSPATYTFQYRKDDNKHTTDTEPAIWHNNGFHYFQGVHVPDRIRYTSNISEIEEAGKAPGLTIDQHNDKADGDDSQLGNYTLLAHYLGMPANFNLTATVERIKLPFRHRLARVVAFVLIDPELNTTLKGYSLDANGKDDPNTTSLRFCNVRVLQGVKDVVESGSGHHTLTPMWARPRKVIPHFDGERGSYNYKTLTQLDDNFKTYTKASANKTEELYPTSSGWKAAHDDATDHKGYTETNYGKVPVYDIIVRPTYTRADSVMYDEENYSTRIQELANVKNSIDFEIELANGLRYEKTFEFDLNANYQTVVYLHISREKVDYNDAGSEIWIEQRGTDDWYGVDNENGNTLSMAGSSWQRAYRTKSVTYNSGIDGDIDKVTDGDLYDNGEDVGQYLKSTSKWTELLLQACKDGKHHGDYFILDEDITINAQDIPANFVFTGHLDAQDHTITLTGTGADTYEETTDYSHTLLYYKETAADSYHKFVMPELYICEEVAQAKPFRIGGSNETIPLGPGKMKRVYPTLAQIMANDVKYYVQEGEEYKLWNPRTWTFYTHRISASSLFCGLDGTYTTAQEEAEKNGVNIWNNPSVVWEANVHKETNKATVWVPTPGYRAEVINAMVKGGTLFPAGATVTGNVQNCFNVDNGDNKTAVTNTPNIPKYK